jgi:hypothetical protein
MEVRLLGHLEVEVSGEAAMLALRPSDAVSADELVEARA